MSTAPNALERTFGRPTCLIGVVHLAPLPGAARAPGRAIDAMSAALERALDDARALEDGGLDGIIVENFGDVPFHGERVPASTVAAMSAIAAELRRAVRLPLGVNVLRNDVNAALAIAAGCGLDFVRVNVHAGAMLTDQGVLQGRAAETLAERRRLGADHVLILADVLVKHAQPLSGAREALLSQMAEDTYRRGLADALIVTGAGTGKVAALGDVAAVRRAVPEAPVLVGSGVTDGTARSVLDVAHGAIVGTWFKRDGIVEQPVDVERVRRFVTGARGALDAPLDSARGGENGAALAAAAGRARARAKTG
ncbi:MAG: BtpA/SgcQ family protein [Candidatus Eisenbacteria bacterium]